MSYENIRSTQNRPSGDPRDQAIRAALHDAATLVELANDEFTATYAGPARDAYLRVFAASVAVVGGRLEQGPDGLHAAFGERLIRIRFDPVSGGR